MVGGPAVVGGGPMGMIDQIDPQQTRDEELPPPGVRRNFGGLSKRGGNGKEAGRAARRFWGE